MAPCHQMTVSNLAFSAVPIFHETLRMPAHIMFTSGALICPLQAMTEGVHSASHAGADLSDAPKAKLLKSAHNAHLHLACTRKNIIRRPSP